MLAKGMTHSAHEIASMTRSGLNLIEQALSIYDSDMKLAVANRRFQVMFNLPDHLIEIGATFADTIRHLATKGDYGEIDDIEAFVKERVEQAKAFQPHYVERLRANGTQISVEGSPLRHGGWVTVYTDITEIRTQESMLRDRSQNLSEQLLTRAEELAQSNRELTATITALEEAKRELTESESRLKLVNEMTPAHIARVNIDGYYTYTNHKLNTIIPGAPKNILGKHIKKAIGPEAFRVLDPRFEEVKSGVSSVFEVSFTETGRQMRVALTPDTDKAGNVIGAYLLSTDITEETNVRSALAHTRRRELAAQLTSGLAHDFSNLLTIILGQQNRLEAMESLQPDVQEIVATTKAAALRGGTLLDGLSQFGSMRPLAIRSVNLSDLLTDTLRLAKAAVPETLELNIINEADDVQLMLDQGFTQDALLNLTLNASEAIEGVGIISVIARRKGSDWLEFIVKDTGPGFSKKALANAFTPFFTTKSTIAGRGLGLSTVFDFAKLSGGNLKLDNQPDSGAIVTLRIPYEAVVFNGSGLVLLVEDNLEIRSTIRGYLRKMGYSVLEADSAEEGLELSRISDLAFIITDLILGGDMNGYDLAKSLREKGQKIPIFVVTGLPGSDSLRAKAAQTFPVLHKPFAAAALADLLQKGLGQ